MKANRSKLDPVRTGLAALLLLLLGTAVHAQSVVTLTARPTSTTLPDGQNVPMWGYACGAVSNNGVPSAPGVSCTTLNGAPQSGGTWQPPLITVPSGQLLTITLKNSLTFTGGPI